MAEDPKTEISPQRPREREELKTWVSNGRSAPWTNSIFYPDGDFVKRMLSRHGHGNCSPESSVQPIETEILNSFALSAPLW